jgi:hypothetical protein
MVWVEKNKNSLNLKFKPYNISWTVKLIRISFKLPNYIVSYYSNIVEHCSSYNDARVCHRWIPDEPAHLMAAPIGCRTGQQQSSLGLTSI